jgi:hypothetical protein
MSPEQIVETIAGGQAPGAAFLGSAADVLLRLKGQGLKRPADLRE